MTDRFQPFGRQRFGLMNERERAQIEAPVAFEGEYAMTIHEFVVPPLEIGNKRRHERPWARGITFVALARYLHDMITISNRHTSSFTDRESELAMVDPEMFRVLPMRS
jgi:hypothetical protein